MKNLIKLISVFFTVINTSNTKKKTINKGSEIAMNTIVSSTNGKYTLNMQEDGNLVLYKGAKALWATATDGKIVKACAFQPDGNLVLYGYNKNAIWASNTDNRGEYLKMQNDGNLVIYDKNQKAIWSTDTWDRNVSKIAIPPVELIDAEIVTINNFNSRYVSFGKTKLVKNGNLLSGNFTQRFSDRSQFNGKKDNTSIEFDLATKIAKFTLHSWGNNVESYHLVGPPNGKTFVSHGADRTIVISLNK